MLTGSDNDHVLGISVLRLSRGQSGDRREDDTTGQGQEQDLYEPSLRSCQDLLIVVQQRHLVVNSVLIVFSDRNQISEEIICRINYYKYTSEIDMKTSGKHS